MTNDFWHELTHLVSRQHIFNALIACLIVLIGRLISTRLSLATERLTRLEPSQRVLFQKIARYAIMALAITAALGQIGVDLKVLLGAAGVLTVAVGFAAQTSASNLISGLFLMFERPFVIGDIITVGDTQGVVMAIDLLSTKIRTFTNLMVRVPNETLVKSSITNQSYFPIRRVDLRVTVDFKTDVSKLERLMREVVTDDPLCMVNPEPVFLFRGFGDFGINAELQVWALSENLITVQNDVYRHLTERFRRENVAWAESPLLKTRAQN